MKRIVGFICLVLFLASLAQADVSILTLDNQTYQGSIVSFSAEDKLSFTLKLASGQEQTIFGENIVEIISNANAAINKELTCVKLNDGSRIYGEIVNGSRNAIILNSPSLGQDFAIGLLKIREIVFPGFQEDKKLTDTVRQEDILFFRSGDKMNCLIESFGKGFVEVYHEQLGVRKEYFDKLKRIEFALLESFEEKAEGLQANIIGIDNSNITGKIIAYQQQLVTFSPAYLETTLNVPLSKIKHIFFKNGKFTYLSDLPKKQYKVRYTSYFPTFQDIYQLSLDQNQRGKPIRLGGQKFYKGIGVLSRTEILVRLNGEYKKFQSSIGIDDMIRELYQEGSHMVGGSVRFQVLVDKKKVYESKTMYSFTPPESINIDVTGKKYLHLVVDFSDNGNINDLANWAGARLIK